MKPLSNNQPRLSFVGGGSGGDTFPVVAVAQAVKAQHPDAACQFFGAPGGIEADLLAAEGFEPELVPAMRLKRSTLLKLPFVLCRGACKAKAALRRHRPQALVAAGGFVSPPVVLAASWLGIPVVLLEPNAVSGRANRALARFASLIVTAYDEVASDFPGGVRVANLGMPLRYRADPSRREATRTADPSRLVFAMMGGSLGALALNEALWSHYETLGTRQGLRVIHITGTRDFAEATRRHEAAGAPVNIEVRAFQRDMPALYDQTDVMVGRGGAMTCHEFVEFSVPALMVPRPNSTGDHTWKNTQPLVAAGACEAYRQADFSATLLLERIDAWLADPSLLKARRAAYAGLRRDDAAAAVAREVLAMAQPVQAVAA